MGPCSVCFSHLASLLNVFIHLWQEWHWNRAGKAAGTESWHRSQGVVPSSVCLLLKCRRNTDAEESPIKPLPPASSQREGGDRFWLWMCWNSWSRGAAHRYRPFNHKDWHWTSTSVLFTSKDRGLWGSLVSHGSSAKSQIFTAPAPLL